MHCCESDAMQSDPILKPIACDIAIFMARASVARGDSTKSRAFDPSVMLPVVCDSNLHPIPAIFVSSFQAPSVKHLVSLSGNRGFHSLLDPFVQRAISDPRWGEACRSLPLSDS